MVNEDIVGEGCDEVAYVKYMYDRASLSAVPIAEASAKSCAILGARCRILPRSRLSAPIAYLDHFCLSITLVVFYTRQLRYTRNRHSRHYILLSCYSRSSHPSSREQNIRSVSQH